MWKKHFDKLTLNFPLFFSDVFGAHIYQLGRKKISGLANVFANTLEQIKCDNAIYRLIIEVTMTFSDYYGTKQKKISTVFSSRIQLIFSPLRPQSILCIECRKQGPILVLFCSAMQEAIICGECKKQVCLVYANQ